MRAELEEGSETDSRTCLLGLEAGEAPVQTLRDATERAGGQRGQGRPTERVQILIEPATGLL